jgi:hypothetical protein
MHTFNLFRRKEEADLYCAVPVDRPVPEFLTEDKWEYARSLNIETLSGFDAAAVSASANANGFYLFHSEAQPGFRHGIGS